MKDILYTIKVEQDGKLLETARRALRGLPSGKVKSFLEHRQISVDGVVTTKFDYPVRCGQEILIRRADLKRTACPLKILYEDDDLLAVAKPAGMLTVATETEREHTVWRILKDCGIGPVYVVHRLDRDTSGVLLLAKSAEIRDRLQENWDSTLRREYNAICEGVFEQRSGVCDSFLAENSAHIMYSSPDGRGKRAITRYRVIRTNGSYSQVLVNIETGRKNQIRVHMKELGHPVVGDKKYGAHGNPLRRLGLHASLLEIIHPRTGQPLAISCPPDRGFRLPK